MPPPARHTGTQLDPLRKQGEGGWLFGLRAEEEGATDSPIRLIPERVCDYFRLVNRRQGVGQAGPVAMCICVYV